MKTKTGAAVDPTLRDSLENGMESTRAKFTRRRRQWTVTIEFLTNDDWRTLDDFESKTVLFGALPFFFPDNRDPTQPLQLLVRFSKPLEYTDANWAGSEYRQHCTFEMREV